MLMSPMGLRSEKGCACDAHQKLKTTDPTCNCLQIIKEIKSKNWSRAPDGCLTPRQPDQLTIGHNITLTLTIRVVV
jgi:hypothetical protein